MTPGKSHSLMDVDWIRLRWRRYRIFAETLFVYDQRFNPRIGSVHHPRSS